jgi:hypothetical protein
MYFYQKNFIYDVSSYPKTKDTTYNIISITIPDVNMGSLTYYLNSITKPKALLSTGNFSPWGAKDVLLSDDWYITVYGTNYVFNFKISANDITSYDINQIKYLIFLDDIHLLQISSSDENFSYLRLESNTQLRVKFNDNTTKDFYLPMNTILSKNSNFIEILSNSKFLIYTVNFNTSALQEINLSSNGYNNFPHFINFKLQRPTNTSARILRVRLILIDRSNTTYTIQTYYFTSPLGETLNTHNVVSFFTAAAYHLGSNSSLKLELAWTSDGSTLTTENTTVEVQCIWFLPTTNFRIYF